VNIKCSRTLNYVIIEMNLICYTVLFVCSNIVTLSGDFTVFSQVNIWLNG
jgi:hypothetical protein